MSREYSRHAFSYYDSKINVNLIYFTVFTDASPSPAQFHVTFLEGVKLKPLLYDTITVYIYNIQVAKIHI